MKWQISADAEQQGITPTTLLAIDVAPGQHRLTLGVRIRTGGGPALWHGAVVRRFLTVETIRWSPILAWLEQAEAAALLARISAGFSSEQLWSGDQIGQWSPDAMAALDALHASISDRA